MTRQPSHALSGNGHISPRNIIVLEILFTHHRATEKAR